jgi:hypothetical protein
MVGTAARTPRARLDTSDEEDAAGPATEDLRVSNMEWILLPIAAAQARVVS